MPLMAGKQGLIMGVANERSLAWGIAKTLHAHGAALAFTYQGEALGKRVRPLAESVDSDFVIEADVTSEESLDAVFDALARRWGRLDFAVHAIAFADPACRRRATIFCAPWRFPATRSPICAGARCR
jgi:enoyl-[acyl-carrier protein] reductase I